MKYTAENCLNVLLSIIIAMLVMQLFKESAVAASPLPPKEIKDEDLLRYCDDKVTANKFIADACSGDILCNFETRARYAQLCPEEPKMVGGLLDDDETETDTDTEEEVEEEEEE